MLMGCLWVAYACIQVSLMVSSTFVTQLPQDILLVSYGFLWQGYFLRCVTSMCSQYVSFFQPLYLFSGLASVLPMSCIHLLCGVPAHCLNLSMELPQGVPCDPYASLLGSCVFHEDCLLIPC